MTITIGGIVYPNDSGMPAAGNMNGFCCRECRAFALEMIRDGRAHPVFGADANTARRFQCLTYIQYWGEDCPPEILSFLLQGGFLSIEERDRLVRLSNYGAVTIADIAANIRLATVYCMYLADDNVHPSWERDYRTHIGRVISAVGSLRFTCVSCQAVVDALPIREQCSAHCPTCRDRLYIRSNLMNTWIPREGVPLLPLPYDPENDLEEDIVTLEWANDNLFFNEETETWSRNMPERLQLRSYSDNPLDSINWDARNKSNALVFGVELEFEPNNSSETGQRGLIRALGGNTGKSYILKGDGSLTWGVELVTNPFTLSQHKDGTGVDWKRITEKIATKAHSGTVTDHCGMHVHINKKALSALTIGKMLVFLNSPVLAPLITTIAQRGSGGYCSRSAKKLTDGTRSSESRYDIMNVSVRHPTCEVRMFRGNLTLERIYKNIEFCHALVQYCRQASMRSLADWGSFSQWLISNRGQYQNLVRFLIDKETIGFRQLAKNVKSGEEIKHISDL